MPATATRRAAAPPRVELVEGYAAGPGLKIDKEAAVIYGVKLGGRFSPNCHKIKGVTEGTEYTPAAYKGALGLYENRKVYPEHAPPDKRGPFDYLGVIRNARYDDAADCPRGDFHYRKSHPHAAQLVEDVERGMGGFGFSHHIPHGGYKGRVLGRRFVVESITDIKSVDLVADPATTRNLWEHREPTVPTTFKALLEKWVADKSANRKAVARDLLEDDAPAMTAPVDAPDANGNGEAGDPEDELWSGFQSAIVAIINGDGTAEEKGRQVAKYLKAHEKLTQDKPAEDKPPEDKPADKPADDSAKESVEVRTLRAENACLKEGVKPSPTLLKALVALDTDADRKALLEEAKAAGQPTPAPKKPTSGVPARTQPKPLTEAVKSREEFVGSIRD
jgi:hypothetical protein